MLCWVIVEDSLVFFKEKIIKFWFAREQPEPESGFCISLFSWNKQTIIVNVVLNLFFPITQPFIKFSLTSYKQCKNILGGK